MPPKRRSTKRSKRSTKRSKRSTKRSTKRSKRTVNPRSDNAQFGIGMERSECMTRNARLSKKGKETLIGYFAGNGIHLPKNISMKDLCGVMENLKMPHQ